MSGAAVRVRRMAVQYQSLEAAFKTAKLPRRKSRISRMRTCEWGRPSQRIYDMNRVFHQTATEGGRRGNAYARTCSELIGVP